MFFLWILFTIVIISGVILLYIIKRQEKEEAVVATNERTTNIKNLHPVNISGGIIWTGEHYLIVARIEGVNFSVMSDIEQNARESALIEIFSRLEYPIRFITNTAIVDTSVEARRIAAMADTPNENLKNYRILYAGALEQMRVDRAVLTQQTFLVVPGQNVEEAEQRFRILRASLSERTSIIVTPLQTTEEIYDSLQDILTPDKIIKPSQVVTDGVLEPFHFSYKEVHTLAEKINQE